MTYRTAAPEVRWAFRALSALDAPCMSLVDAATGLHVDGYVAETLLDELVNLHLLGFEYETGQTGEHRYRLLPSLRSVGRQLPLEAQPRGRSADSGRPDRREGGEPVPVAVLAAGPGDTGRV
jgi:hypothetical protein